MCRIEITAPAEPVRGNRAVLVEPPHPLAGLGALEQYLGRGFLFPRGCTYAGIGWSTTTYGKDGNLRILDPTVPGVFIEGGVKDTNGRTDNEIIADFARAQAASDIVVPHDFPTIQAAIDAAAPGATITIRRGTYTEQTMPIRRDRQLHDLTWIAAPLHRRRTD